MTMPCHAVGRTALVAIAVLALSGLALPLFAASPDPPHSAENLVDCESCHDVHHGAPSLLTRWYTHVPENLDDTGYNSFCWSCHNDVEAPYRKTHSSVTTSSRYGDWTIECRVCHDPHAQQQLKTWGSAAYIYAGPLTAVTPTTLQSAGAGWTEGQFAGRIVVPNVLQPRIYQIVGNSADTLTVKGPMDVTNVNPGDTFAITYGKLVRSAVDLSKITVTPPKSGQKTVRFFNSTGDNSFADGIGALDGICEVCHTQTEHFRNDGSGPDQLHTSVGAPAGTRCTSCHSHKNGFAGMGSGSHGGHVTSGGGPRLVCTDCHGSNTPPTLADGQALATTTVCNNCHSLDGAASAKTHWATPGAWLAAEGEAGFCGSCHDGTPGNSKRDGTGTPAPNIVGTGTTYGYFVTGHGKASGNYPRLAWQDSAAVGNPAANQGCSACHDLTTPHFGGTTNRLKSGFANDANNSNCKQCHNPGTVAVADPQWYTTFADYEASAHKTVANLKCSDCHDVHGASGAYTGMTRQDKETLCLGCHVGQAAHSLGAAFTLTTTGKSYTLQCTSCHNVHIVTGKYATDSTKSPMTRLTAPTAVWGADSGQKMATYAGSGTYRTPNGDTLNGAQLPDYPTFCQDCHAAMPNTWGPDFPWRNWGGDQHGGASANEPNGYGTCPNWFACGNAFGWEGDDRTGTQSEAWPAVPRGAGDQLYSRGPYTHTQRIAGANFVLSCSDCHVTHESGVGAKMRGTINGVSGLSGGGNWNTLCNACHYYYSDWHAGMSCGNASCHEVNTIHRAKKMSGSGATRSFNPDLVLDYRFENNLKDSGGYQMDGKWYSAAGSFAAGKSGQAAVLGPGQTVQVGTEDGYWSTDDGKHGTWKYTEMKFNTTLEAWVYPTDQNQTEYTIFNRHVGVSDGGYGFALKKVGGLLRAAFNMQADSNGFSPGGAAGVRGAYSSVAIPLNQWTHVGASFDTAGPDGSPTDLSAGRIRIYVNGEDVTTSDATGNNRQPGAGETSIFAYSENSPENQSVCYAGTWCASEFSIGGFDWQTGTNFIGMVDSAKVWNVTKPASYFAAYDAQAGPYIASVSGLIGNTQLTVAFSEGVYTNSNATGALEVADFAFVDAGGDNPRAISAVAHTAGSSAAILTMSQPLTAADVGADTLAAASGAIYDEYGSATTTAPVAIGLSSQCPSPPVEIPFSEAPGSAFIMDTQGVLYGVVNGGAATLTGSEFSGGGDGSGRYIQFDYNTSCLTASTAMTAETRIKPTGIADATYIRRILARDGSGNFQISVWRNNAWNPGTYSAPAGEASIALWVRVDRDGTWRPVLTNYTGGATGSENACPIVSDHWYRVKAVWNTGRPGGVPGEYFQPADIYVEDQGTDGLGSGRAWSGFLNCTDTDQSLKPDTAKFQTGDVIRTATGEGFTVGVNRANPANNLFSGLIDWIRWSDSADYSGVLPP